MALLHTRIDIHTADRVPERDSTSVSGAWNSRHGEPDSITSAMSNVTAHSTISGDLTASSATDRELMPPPSVPPSRDASIQHSRRPSSTGVRQRSSGMSLSSLPSTWHRNRTKSQRRTSLADIEFKISKALDQGAQNEKAAACNALNYAERHKFLVYRFATYFLSRLGTKWSLDVLPWREQCWSLGSIEKLLKGRIRITTFIPKTF